MRKEVLVMNIYRMNDRRGCLVMVVKGKPLKVLDIIEPLRFVGWMKQLSIAINTGANQDCKHDLECLNGTVYVLKCRFAQEVVTLELSFKQQHRMSWLGTAKEFGFAVDRMIAQLPRFFK